MRSPWPAWRRRGKVGRRLALAVEDDHHRPGAGHADDVELPGLVPDGHLVQPDDLVRALAGRGLRTVRRVRLGLADRLVVLHSGPQGLGGPDASARDLVGPGLDLPAGLPEGVPRCPGGAAHVGLGVGVLPGLRVLFHLRRSLSVPCSWAWPHSAIVVVSFVRIPRFHIGLYSGYRTSVAYYTL